MHDFLKKIGFALFAFLMLLSCAVAVFYTLPQLRIKQSNTERRDALQAELLEIQEEIAHYKRNLVRFNTSPYFVEQLARSNHRISDKEIVFVFE